MARITHTRHVQAFIGGLGAAFLWAGATVASSRSSRMIGSRVVLGWIMVVGLVVGIPLGLMDGIPAMPSPPDLCLLLLSGLCYAGGLGIAYAALTIGKVGVVAPIVATEGAIAAVLAVILGDELAAGAAILLGVIVAGVVLSSIEPARPDVMAGDFEIAADALEAPPAAAASDPVLPVTVPRESVALDPGAPAMTQPRADTRRAAVLAVAAAIIFGIGMVATGRAAVHVAPIWVAVSVRFVGLVVVVIPLLLQRRMYLTRAALPLVVISGTGEILGTTLSAWGASVNIAVAAVLGSQFAAIAAVAAYFLFGERLSRTQVIGVILIVAGVTALGLISA